jgi:hypothetical protein
MPERCRTFSRFVHCHCIGSLKTICLVFLFARVSLVNFSIFVHQNPGSRYVSGSGSVPYSAKIPDSLNPDPKQWSVLYHEILSRKDFLIIRTERPSCGEITIFFVNISDML